MLLSDIKKPGFYQISSITGSEAVRLLEMGLTPGAEIELVRSAPLGYPIEIKIRGYSLTIRKQEANCIELK